MLTLTTGISSCILMPILYGIIFKNCASPTEQLLKVVTVKGSQVC